MFVPKSWLDIRILLAGFKQLLRQTWDHQNIHTYPPLLDLLVPQKDKKIGPPQKLDQIDINLCLPKKLLLDQMDINLCPPAELLLVQIDINLCPPAGLLVDQRDINLYLSTELLYS